MEYGTFGYPWDLVGDNAAAGRFADLGTDTVTLAAAYHSVRAITPHHPAHRIVQAHYAAAYFPIHQIAWHGRRLRPAVAAWGVPDADPFGTAAAMARDAGLRVEAWVVLTHNTRLGLRCQDLTVRNTFGDRYAYALCPSHPEVRDYVGTLVGEVAALYGDTLSGIVLEACGWLGFDHGSHHDKTGDLTPEERELLSVCLCLRCRRALGTADAAELLGPARPRLLAYRAMIIEDLLRTARSAAAGTPITLMAADGLEKTGPDVGVPLADFAELVDAYLLKCWGDHKAAVTQLSAARATTSARLLANVNILEPGNDNPDTLTERLKALTAAGADGFRFYHGGLATTPQRQSLHQTLKA